MKNLWCNLEVSLSKKVPEEDDRPGGHAGVGVVGAAGGVGAGGEPRRRQRQASTGCVNTSPNTKPVPTRPIGPPTL